MAENNSGPIEAVRGIVSGAIGFTKQVIGLILSRSELQEEGRAQVEKASHQLDAARAEAEAEAARAKAEAQETRQKAASNSK
ncbi:CsbD family protein [Mycolicibacterium tusciae]|uniref:CsbD family protein n=1 Tax=Mycolicibacterium tusciae TaxID=75922 RepID=A0A1X0JRC3_9MYCO|nr:CsbD family protein [Mycolicibacterium tusciae]ORB65489.1 CsbD family protein [Mycolicibacterium tusciae]